ncbi:MAG: type II toxin-antitoxin system VapC family toxin [Candidatus Dormibacteria bacterium]
MNGKAAYLDASAILKLIVREPESQALQRFLAQWPHRSSSTLVRTETIRALRRSGYDTRVGDARRVMGTMRLVRLDEPLLDRAADLEPRTLRSLDAVHLASALALGSDLGVFIAYDNRLIDAARAHGIPVDEPR